MNEPIFSLMNDEEFDVAEGDDEQIQRLKQKATRKRGRGFELTSIATRDERTPAFRRSGRVSSATDADGGRDDEFSPQRSVEGWLLLATNVHEEAQEEDIFNEFGAYGLVKNLHLNLDRRTGFVKGYAFVEYETYKEAVVARKALNRSQFLGQTIEVDWAISQRPLRVQTYLSRHRKRKSNK